MTSGAIAEAIAVMTSSTATRPASSPGRRARAHRRHGLRPAGPSPQPGRRERSLRRDLERPRTDPRAGREYVRQGIAPGGTHANRRFLSNWVAYDADITECEQLLLCDAQTSGGLLAALSGDQADGVVRAAIARGNLGCVDRLDRAWRAGPDSCAESETVAAGRTSHRDVRPPRRGVAKSSRLDRCHRKAAGELRSRNGLASRGLTGSLSVVSMDANPRCCHRDGDRPTDQGSMAIDGGHARCTGNIGRNRCVWACRLRRMATTTMDTGHHHHGEPARSRPRS